MDKETEKLTYSVIEGMAKEHYDSIYGLAKIREEDAEVLLKEIDYLKTVVDNRIIERNILIKELKKIILFFALTAITAPFMLSGDLLLVIAFLTCMIAMVKNMRELEPLRNELAHKYDEERIRIERILNNCERMVNRKVVTSETQEFEKNALEDECFLDVYANYILEYYFETGQIMEYLNPEFDAQVKQELLQILREKYQLSPEVNFYEALEIARSREENGPKLTKNR